jgi:hypothetical protein
MEARLILRKNKLAIVFSTCLMAGLLSGNVIAQSWGWLPSSELVRNVRARTAKRVRELFN